MFLWDATERVIIAEGVKTPLFYVLWAGLAIWAMLVLPPGLVLHAYLLLAGLLSLLSVIDIRHFILPDLLTLPGIVLGFVLAPMFLGVPLIFSLAGALVGGGLFALLAVIFYALRKRHGLGFGDVKLLAMVGAWGGVIALLPTVLFASIAALLYLPVRMVLEGVGLRQPVPFGPFLALGGWLSILHQDVFWLTLFEIHRAMGTMQ
jgi:prepilin signal peptidase PulO-like enzyme (type II secretory pathway)